MGKSLLKGAILGGITLFIWGVVSWMVLPWHGNMFKSFSNQEYVGKVIAQNASESGVYYMPGMGCEKGLSKMEKERAKQNMMESMKRGPVMFAVVHPRGVEGMGAGMFVGSIIIQVIAAFLLSLLLLKTDLSMSYWSKVFFVVIVMLTAGVVTDLPNWNWMGYPTDYTLLNLLDMVLGGLFAGLVLAAVVKRPA